MPDLSISADLDFFQKVVPSKIFEIGLFNTVHVEHNRSIAALTDPVALGYTKNLDKIVCVLKDPDIAHYQDQLLRKAVKGICAEKVDIDHIQIGLKLTEQDIEALLDPEFGLTIVKTKARMARLRVAQKCLGAANQGFKKSDLKPFFSHKYRMFMDSDEYRYMDVLIADVNHPRNDKELQYNCLIECIPTRLTPQHISLMLFHVKSALKPGRYDQLIKHALLLRLDTGYVMHGVSQLFAFTLRKNKQVKVGSCIPHDRAVETTYIGDRSYKHVIAYDKPLKENKLFIEAVFGRQRIDFERIADKIDGIADLFINQIASLRIESRDLMNKYPQPLCSMDECRSLLEDVLFVRPKALLDLDTKWLKALVKDKTLEKVRKLRKHLASVHQCLSNKYLIRFNDKQVQAAFKPILTELKNAIYNPSKDLNMPVLVNYSEKVIEARKIVAPLIKDLKGTHDSPEEIAQCSKPAIYVEGCPGSGKTDLIIKRVQHLVASGVPAASICVLAFTKKASEEFKERLKSRGLLKPAMFVGTFSSWCNQELLESRGNRVLNQKGCIKQIQSLLPKKGRIAEQFDAEDLARMIVSVMNHAANFDQPVLSKCIKEVAPQLDEFIKEVSGIIDDFEDWKNAEDRVDFNDLLVSARKRLMKKAVVAKTAKRFSHIILDEVQDTNTVQWDILERLNEAGSHFFCVGDPAQSMFGFRGANDEKLRKFSRFFKDAKVFQLINNYRSTPELVELANHMRRKINRNYSQSEATCPNGLLPRYKEARDLKSAIDWIVADIKALERNSPESDCLVLCRYNPHKESVEKALAAEGIVSSESSTIRVEAMTYHGSKGLEADSCYVVDPLFSNYRLGTKKEELCNTYVAFTRAKNKLTIIASDRGSALYGNSDEAKSGISIFAQLCNDFEDVSGKIDFIY